MTFHSLFTLIFWVPLIGASIRIAAPLLFASLGETLAERAGLLNVGIEGMMTLGAFMGFATAVWTNDLSLAFVVAALTGAFAGLIFGGLTVLRGADQVVTGIVMNILAAGIAAFLYDRLFGSSANVPQLMPMLPYHVLWLSTLPIIGRPVFTQTPVVFCAFLLAPIIWILLNATRWGLNVRAAGENPEAVESSGINVWRLRMQVMAAAGALAGIGGATVAVAQVGAYVDGMISGRGFIALAIVVFGGWRPGRVVAAALLFGLADALQLRLQVMGIGLPDQLLVGLPYLLTIVVVSLVANRAGYPAAINRAYLPRRRHTKGRISSLFTESKQTKATDSFQSIQGDL